MDSRASEQIGRAGLLNCRNISLARWASCVECVAMVLIAYWIGGRVGSLEYYTSNSMTAVVEGAPPFRPVAGHMVLLVAGAAAIALGSGASRESSARRACLMMHLIAVTAIVLLCVY